VHDPIVCGIAYVTSCSACQDAMDAALTTQVAKQRRRWVTEELGAMNALLQGLGAGTEVYEVVEQRAEELAWAFAWRHQKRKRPAPTAPKPVETTWEYVTPLAG
jgi:hypothetical protein